MEGLQLLDRYSKQLMRATWFGRSALRAAAPQPKIISQFGQGFDSPCMPPAPPWGRYGLPGGLGTSASSDAAAGGSASRASGGCSSTGLVGAGCAGGAGFGAFSHAATKTRTAKATRFSIGLSVPGNWRPCNGDAAPPSSGLLARAAECAACSNPGAPRSPVASSRRRVP